jgi:dCMP deaminase
MAAMSESEKHVRAPWDDYFMNIAQVVATRSTCQRKFVGSVLVRDRMILSTGYNGSIRGMPHCTEVGHMMDNDHCVATIHAEMNAILQAARNGINIDKSTVYVTASPCWNCFKALMNSGVNRICFGEFYRDERIFEVAEKLGIELLHVELATDGVAVAKPS